MSDFILFYSGAIVLENILKSEFGGDFWFLFHDNHIVDY